VDAREQDSSNCARCRVRSAWLRVPGQAPTHRRAERSAGEHVSTRDPSWLQDTAPTAPTR